MDSPRMTVPLLDLKAQYRTIRQEVQQAITEVLESQRFILGPQVKALEQELKDYLGVADAIGVASGSDALLISLMALDVGYGDAVITTPFTFFATAGSIARLGALPVFVDIEPDTYNLDPERVREFLETQTEERDGRRVHRRGGRTWTVKALMPVHLYGQSVNLEPLLEIARTYGLAVIEDAAQAIGSEYRGRRVGGFGTFGAFSFFPSKNLGGYGDGGLVVTQDPDLAEKVRMLRVHGSRRKYYHDLVGLNSRLDELQAAVLRVKLPHLDTWNQKRAERAERYGRLLEETGLVAEGLVTPPRVAPYATRHIYHQYTIRARHRDALVEHLKAHGVGVAIYYPVPLHLQNCFRHLGYREGDLPVSEQAAREVLSLPIYPELTDEQQDYVVEVIQRFYRA